MGPHASRISGMAKGSHQRGCVDCFNNDERVTSQGGTMHNKKKGS